MSSKPKAATSSPSKTSAKPSADARTINLITGKTALEEAEEIRRIAEAEDAKEAPKERTPLSSNEERKAWEARGTVHMKDIIQGFRLTELKDGGYVLERMCWKGNSKEPYAYGIFIFHKDLLVKLRDAINEKLGADNVPHM